MLSDGQSYECACSDDTAVPGEGRTSQAQGLALRSNQVAPAPGSCVSGGSGCRSFSNLGSSLSAVLGTLCIVFSPDLVAIFYFSIIPFLIDFLLVASYPSYMNNIAGEADAQSSGSSSIWNSVMQPLRNLSAVLQDSLKRRALISSSVGVAVFKSTKHYIQPIVLQYLDQLPVGSSEGQEDNSELTNTAAITLGILYSVYFLFSAIASRFSYLLLERCNGAEKLAMDVMLVVFALIATSIGLSLQLNVPLVAVVLFVFLYMSHNVRKPIASIMVAELGGKKQRATLLSVESLLSALFASCLAPICGQIAESFSIVTLFLFIAGGSLVVAGCLWGSDIGEEVEEVPSDTGPERHSDEGYTITNC